MIGDKIIIEPIHELKAKSVYSYLQVVRSLNEVNKYIITISGGSGTGKSEVAELLREKLFKEGKHSLIVQLDDYYDTDRKERNLIRKKRGINSVGVNEIEWRRIIQIIFQFLNDKEVKFRRYNLFLESYEYSVADGRNIDFLIIEGLYSSYINEIINFKKTFAKNTVKVVNIFLDGDLERTYEFRLKRGKENPNDLWRQEIVKKEYQVVKNLEKYSDCIIPF